MDPSHVILIVSVGLFTAVAAVCDVRTRRLPNWLTAPACLAGLVFHLAAGACSGDSALGGAASGLGHALAGLAVGFTPLLLLWLVGGGGAGDAKLMAAVGAWLGPEYTCYTYVLSVLAAGAVSLVLLGWSLARPRPAPAGGKGAGAAAPLSRGQWRAVPYGLPVALATWTVLAWRMILPV